MIVWAFAALVCELIAERFIGSQSTLPVGAQIAVALAPLVPSLLFMRALVRMVAQMDELQRRIALESVFIAFISTLLIAFVLSALEQAGLFRPRWGSTGTLMMALWAGAYLFSSWKYR